MAKSREQMQDATLAGFKRASRSAGTSRDYVEVTLAEQLANLAKEEALSPTDKLKKMTFNTWFNALIDESEKMRRFSRGRFTNWIFAKRRSELETYHKNGTALKEVIMWMDDQQTVFRNL